MVYAKALREKLGRIGADIQALIDKAKAENNRGLTSDERTKFHALETDYTALEGDIKIAERGQSIVDRLAAPGTPVPGAPVIDEAHIEELRAEFHLSPAEKRRKDNEKNPHARAFSNYLRLGENRLAFEDRQILSGFSASLPPEVRNAMSTTTGTKSGSGK